MSEQCIWKHWQARDNMPTQTKAELKYSRDFQVKECSMKYCGLINRIMKPNKPALRSQFLDLLSFQEIIPPILTTLIRHFSSFTSRTFNLNRLVERKYETILVSVSDLGCTSLRKYETKKKLYIYIQ